MRRAGAASLAWDPALLRCCAVISKLRPSPLGDALPAAARLLLQPEGVGAEPRPGPPDPSEVPLPGQEPGMSRVSQPPFARLWAASGGLSGTTSALGQKPLESLDRSALLRRGEAAG